MQELELMFVLKALRKILVLGEKEDAIEMIDEVLAEDDKAN